MHKYKLLGAVLVNLLGAGALLYGGLNLPGAEKPKQLRYKSPLCFNRADSRMLRCMGQLPGSVPVTLPDGRWTPPKVDRSDKTYRRAAGIPTVGALKNT